jgi:hypothetical protein
MRLLLLAAISMAGLLAQQPIAPTPDSNVSGRGDNWSDYNIVDSFETGYRFASVGGNYSQYQSMVNFQDGARLLGGYFSMNSKDGHGKYFDELVITTSGLGGDPYENAMLRIAKNGLYRYDMSWRRNDYVNPGLTTDGAQGGHVLDTQYDMQDHDLTLFPESTLKFFVGYTETCQTGPGLSSVQLQSGGVIYPLFENLSIHRHEYRAGNEFKLFGFRVNWMHGWEDFKQDTPYSMTNGGAPISLTPGLPLTAFQRTEPNHGTSPYWRVMLFRDLKNFSLNGRFTYTGGDRGFVLDETSTAPSRFGAQQNQQVLTFGDAKRPVATGNFTVSWLPVSKLTVTNSTAVYNVRTEGSSQFLQYDNATQSLDILYYNYLGIRTVSNETDANYQLLNWLGFSGGFQYSNRLIRSNQEFTLAGSNTPAPYSQTDQQRSGTLGIRLRPYKGLTVVLDGEVGNDTRPLTPASGKTYHALNAKVQYKLKKFSVSGNAQSNYRFTPVSLSAYSSESRTYSANGSYVPNEWLSFDAGYSRLHIYSLGGIAYFENFQLVQGESSLYLSNINAINFGARFALKKRAEFYVGYSGVQDVGDGRSTPDGAGIASANPVFQAVQTFPVKFDSPMARFSMRLNERVRWNLGYQYYGYRERFYPAQDYRANTGYSSLTWSF